MQINTTPIRLTGIKQTEQTKCGQNIGQMKPSHIAGGNLQVGQPLWKTVWQFLNKSLFYDAAILHPGVYSREMRTWKDLYVNVHNSFIHNSEKRETIQMSINR